MESSKIRIREMESGEEKQLLKVARNAFHSIEALFVSVPKTAMVAEYDGVIVGGMIYNIMTSDNKKIAYIDEAFVDVSYQSMGIGKQLYNKTIEHLWNLNCDVITAMVKDDNVASWKLVENNGFKKVGFNQIVKEIGSSAFFKHFYKTPFLIAVGMDFYMADKNKTVKEKRNGISQFFIFLFANILLLLPLWIQNFIENKNSFLQSFIAYFTVLLVFVCCRAVGKIIGKNKWHFRLNNGGVILPLLLSVFGCTFLMNGNWYPDEYDNTDVFKKKLAIPELTKWLVFSLLPLLGFIDNTYFSTLSKTACYFLIFMIIPIYPFESLGAGRIFRYNKKIWLATFIVSVAELAVLFSL